MELSGYDAWKTATPPEHESDLYDDDEPLPDALVSALTGLLVVPPRPFVVEFVDEVEF